MRRLRSTDPARLIEAARQNMSITALVKVVIEEYLKRKVEQK
jgi:hypothetical protein